MTGIITKNKHDKTLRIKKEFQYKENSGGDSNSDTEKEDHTESTTHVHKGANTNKEDGKKPASDDESLTTGESKERSTGGARHSGKDSHT